MRGLGVLGGPVWLSLVCIGACVSDPDEPGGGSDAGGSGGQRTDASATGGDRNTGNTSGAGTGGAGTGGRAAGGAANGGVGTGGDASAGGGNSGARSTIDGGSLDAAMPEGGNHADAGDGAVSDGPEPTLGCNAPQRSKVATFALLTVTVDGTRVALDISGDGSTVVGTRYGSGSAHQTEGLSWTQSGAQKSLGNFNPEDVNCDGSVVVGMRGSVVGSSSQRAPVRWTAGTLTPLPSNGAPGRAVGTTSDGNLVIGQTEWSDSNPDGPRALFWMVTPTGTTLTEGPPRTAATHVSASGHFILGYLGEFTQAPPNAPSCRWSGDSCTVLPFDVPTRVTHMSADGSTFVGHHWVRDPSVQVPFRRKGALNTDIRCPGAHDCQTTGVSSRGRYVVLTCSSDLEPIYTSFVWDEKHGARELLALLAQHGALLPDHGVPITTPAKTPTVSVAGISHDGLVFAGDYFDPWGARHVFRATLPESAYD